MSHTPTPARRHLRRALIALMGGALAAGALAPLPALAEAPLPNPDGKSELTAAASCWEIKQRDPSSASGVYWLWTPQLGAADRFYCDQTTDGGGWVLIARGRENFSTTDEGRGTADQVRDPITGQAAFDARQLPSRTVEALLGGQKVSELTDGVRLRRALDVAGSNFQEVRFTFSSPRDDWSWMFNNQQRVKTWKVGNASGTGGNTSGFGSGGGQNRVDTSTGSTQGWSDGFGYGADTKGSNAASSWMWSKDANSGYARGFTQVFLRPKTTSSTLFTAIPDAGSPASTVTAVASSFALPTNWGIAGKGAGPSSIEGSVQGGAFTEANGVVYVGGNFTTVQKTAAGGSAVAQPYLAAFDRATGELKTAFRPVFNNQVKALAALPDGRIAVGGYFTQVNGQPKAGLVVLDPTTGATSNDWTGRIIDRTNNNAFVRSLDVQDGWLYVGGIFTHSTGGSTSTEWYTKGAARLSVANGTPDGSWNPELNGRVMSLDASARGDRVYLAGFFTASKGTATDSAAALTTSGAAVVPWSTVFSDTKHYQQAVKEVGDTVWLGGSEHSFFSYGRADLKLISSTVGNAGGDFQAAATDGKVIYGSCHCFQTQYMGSKTWPNIGQSWYKAEKINSVGAWDAATGRYLDAFNPSVNQAEGAGGWALFVDSTGTLWAGGDYTYSETAPTKRQWSGGFVRFPLRDSTAPTTPTSLSVTSAGSQVALSWGGSADASGAVTYQVLRNDRVVATTTTNTITLPDAPAATKYFVRAADAAGNISASTPAARIGSTPPPVDPVGNPNLITAGSTWSYKYDGEAAPAGWNTAGFDAAGWSSGAAPLGWGTSAIATTVTSTVTPKPLTAYYRKAVDISTAGLGSVTLTTRADDGIVVYVNGTEVARKNIDAGAVTVGTYANAAPSTAAAVAAPVTVTVPASAFVNGRNVISAEVHANYRSTPNTSFELTATASTGGTTPVDVPDPEDPVDPGAPTDPGAGGALPAGTTLLAPGSSWSYSYPVDAPAADWRTAAFDAGSWATGAAPVGWGSASIATTVTATATPKPSSLYFRGGFDLAAGASVPNGLTVTTRADDGIIVFLNGTEIGRSNLIPGTIGHNTYANSAPSTAAAVASPVVFDVPANLVVSGRNTIAVQVVSNYRSSPSVSFDLGVVVK
ncbi:hypothetical protein GCM10027515_20430 [Schumannella luteola]|uniref:Beta-galactosidase jelly roll domain-containing protein n=1 Tax=Schumannella luteola TaxID=472059 RepID=A0A852YFV4_9MICO|nr:fibrinogen-like YCDxxxxGGGW domain-containing protein [Schumannella luteola]NYH00161.1 hypothetical protein [Schumannella luteola]TPX04080.1 galactose oxidase [Schumannella luteola]